MRISAALATALTTALLAVASAATPAFAQDAFARPRLAASADTNSWEEYFDAGVVALTREPEHAESYFYWASRLDPARPEPLYARWVAFHLTNIHRWEDYLADRPKVMQDVAVMQHDSLRDAAIRRNPFVHRGLELLLFDRMEGRFGDDEFTRGMIAYAKPNFPRAVMDLGRVSRRNRPQYRAAHELRAQAFVAMQQFDSAMAEMLLLRTLAEQEDARHAAVEGYQSKELLDYSIGMLYAARHQLDSARVSLQQAIVESAVFYPAHLWLGDVALDAGDATGAAAEYEQALAVESQDVIVLYHYGIALSRLGRLPAAASTLWQVTSLAPSYAAPFFALAETLDRGGDATGAQQAYADFLARAPRRDTDRVNSARARLTALGPAAR